MRALALLVPFAVLFSDVPALAAGARFQDVRVPRLELRHRGLGRAPVQRTLSTGRLRPRGFPDLGSGEGATDEMEIEPDLVALEMVAGAGTTFLLDVGFGVLIVLSTFGGKSPVVGLFVGVVGLLFMTPLASAGAVFGVGCLSKKSEPMFLPPLLAGFGAELLAILLFAALTKATDMEPLGLLLLLRWVGMPVAQAAVMNAYRTPKVTRPSGAAPPPAIYEVPPHPPPLDYPVPPPPPPPPPQMAPPSADAVPGARRDPLQRGAIEPSTLMVPVLALSF